MSLEAITKAIKGEISKLNQVLRLLEGGAKASGRKIVRRGTRTYRSSPESTMGKGEKSGTKVEEEAIGGWSSAHCCRSESTMGKGQGSKEIDLNPDTPIHSWAIPHGASNSVRRACFCWRKQSIGPIAHEYT